MESNATDKHLEIKHYHMAEFFAKSGLEKAELASLLNVSVASVRRWLDEERPENPTSTAFLVLIPLLLAAGVEILPPPDPSAIDTQMAALQALGINPERLRREEAKKQIQRSVSMLTCEEVAASRALFRALIQAWATVDAASSKPSWDS